MAVRKKVQRKRMRAGAGVSPAGRRRRPATGGGVTGGPRSSRTRKPKRGGGSSGGGSGLRARFASLGPKEKRAAARRIARRRGR